MGDHRQWPATERTRPGRARLARERRESDLAAHGRAGLLHLGPDIGPVAQEDGAAVLESPARLLLRGGDDGARRKAAGDRFAQETEPRTGGVRVEGDAAVAQQIATVTPDRFEHVAVEPLVLAALPEIPGEARVSRHGGARERLQLRVGLRRARNEIGPVVEEPDVEE